jgi:hypothetical protein
LASITGNISNIIENKKFKEHASSLYFKYLTAFSDVKTTQNSKNNSKINVSGKKILLIDDEEDKGWSDVLKNIFFDAEFEFITAGVDFIERATAVAFALGVGQREHLCGLRQCGSQDSAHQRPPIRAGDTREGRPPH